MRRAAILGVLVVFVVATILIVRSMRGAGGERPGRGERSDVARVDGPEPGEAEPAPETEPDLPSVPEPEDAEPEPDPEREAKKIAALRPGEGVVTGKVLERGAPVPAGVQVKLEGAEYSDLAQTDGEGGFRFERVPPGDYALRAQHGDSAQSRIEFRMGADQGAGPFEITLKPPAPPPGVVTGTVGLVDGGPIPDARVVLRKEDKSRGFVRFLEAGVLRSDARGEFRFERLAPGRYDLTAVAADLAMHRVEFDLPEREGAGPFDIRLKPGGRLLVRVVGAFDAPIPDQQVAVESEARTGLRGLGGRTDANGELLLKNLPVGPYWVRRVIVREELVEVPGTDARTVRRTEEGPVRVTSVEEGKTAEVVFLRACGMRGTVYGRDGKPLTRAIVRLTPVKFGKEGYRSVHSNTDQRGGYEIEGFPPGEYKVTIQSLGEQHYVVEVGRLSFETGDIREQELRVPNRSLSGRIVAADTGKPFDRSQEGVRGSQAQARLVEVEDGKVKAWLGKHSTAFADKEGRFTFVGLEPGMYWIWFPSPTAAYSDATRIVDYTAGGDLGGLEIKLEPRRIGTLRLTVLEPDGSAATGLRFAYRASDRSTRTLFGKQVGDGTWDFPLEVGAQQVCVMRGGVEPEIVEVPIAEGETIERTVTLRVREEDDG